MDERLTALLTDRSESFLIYLSILLQRMDFDVLPVSDGPSLLKLNKAVNPVLIILGPDVPEMSTLDVLKALQQDKENDVPVLVIDEDRSKESEYRASGCAELLTKPVDVELLHSFLARLRPGTGSKRRHMRADFRNKVTLTLEHQIIKCQGVTLSEGGIFIRKKAPFPQGSRLQIEIPLDGNETLFVDGEVIYTKQLSENRFTIPPGMAVRFMNMIEEDRMTLKKFIKNLLVGDLLEEQDEQILKQ
jgi:CheY-like chemotaxis protein